MTTDAPVPKPGDLVVPGQDVGETLLFSDPWTDSPMSTDQPVLLWSPGKPGLLLGFKFRNEFDYPIAEVLVGEIVGYTYTDYIKKISSQT